MFSCFARPNSFYTVPRASRFVSCFALPDMFSAVSSASGPVFMFCAPGLIFGGPEGDGSRSHVLCARIRFRRYRRIRVPFSCFARPNSFSAVPRASGPVFIFFALEHVFGGAEGVGSHFHVLRSHTRFRRYRGRRLSFFNFCVPGLIFGGTEGVGSCFHVLRA
jgi:hypothetical protein